MSLFSKILDKLGLKKPEEAAPAAKDKVDTKPSASSRSPQQAQRPAPTSQPAQRQPGRTVGTSGSVPASQTPAAQRPAGQTPASQAPASQAPAGRPAPMEMVDVMKKLETMAEGTNLDWRVSIVDLLKVLDIDSSLAARKELAMELGAPPDVMQDNVKMNVWLHKTVLSKIAENGGNIPRELLD